MHLGRPPSTGPVRGVGLPQLISHVMCAMTILLLCHTNRAPRPPQAHEEDKHSLRRSGGSSVVRLRLSNRKIFARRCCPAAGCKLSPRAGMSALRSLMRP